MFNLFELLHMGSLYISIWCSEAYHVNWLSKLHVNDFGPVRLFFSLDISMYSVTCIWHDIERCIHTKKKKTQTAIPHTLSMCGRKYRPYSVEEDINYAETKWKGEKKNHSLNTYQLGLRSFIRADMAILMHWKETLSDN